MTPFSKSHQEPTEMQRMPARAPLREAAKPDPTLAAPRGRSLAAVIEPLDTEVDHLRGPADEHVILEYGDYECPYSRYAYRLIEAIEAELPIRFAFRHFPLIEIHSHALPASLAAEAAAAQGRLWDMHNILFEHQTALRDRDLRQYATALGLDLERFECDRSSNRTWQRVYRDVRSGRLSRAVRATPTLFVDGALWTGGLDAGSLLEALGV